MERAEPTVPNLETDKEQVVEAHGEGNGSVSNDKEENVTQIDQEVEKEQSLDVLPSAHLKRKRGIPSPRAKEKEKRDRVEPVSDSSSSGDLNRFFPNDSPNKISFLTIELKSSTPRAAKGSSVCVTAKGSSGEKQVQPPGFSVIEIKDEPVSQEIEML